MAPIGRQRREQQGVVLAPCPRCGALAPVGGRWCGACGAVLEPPQAPPIVAQPLVPALRSVSDDAAQPRFGAVELALLLAALICAAVGVFLLVAG
jgi:hypothetical protein